MRLLNLLPEPSYTPITIAAYVTAHATALQRAMYKLQFDHISRIKEAFSDRLRSEYAPHLPTSTHIYPHLPTSTHIYPSMAFSDRLRSEYAPDHTALGATCHVACPPLHTAIGHMTPSLPS